MNTRPKNIATAESIVEDTAEFLRNIADKYGYEKVCYCKDCKHGKRWVLFGRDLFLCRRVVPDWDMTGEPPTGVWYQAYDYCSKGETKEDSKE